MENFIHPLVAIESLGFVCFRTYISETRNRKFYFTFTSSPKHGIIVRVGYPSVGKFRNHIVELYKLK